MKWVPDKTGRFAQRPHYLPEDLDAECERVIAAFLKKKYGKVEYPVKTDDLTLLIEERADLDSYADLSSEGADVEGVTEFMSGRRPLVKISQQLSAPHLENRLRTTLTHEYGHVHFHQFMFEGMETQKPSLFASEKKADGNKCHRDTMIGAPERDWMEWQAGYVCGAILMPISALLEAVRAFRAENNQPYSNIVVGSDLGTKLIDYIAARFRTSKDASRVRLLKRGILLDMGDQKTQELF
ncbi:MAG: hypothetical protein WB679_20390 [Terracidiphilus sp.]